MEIECPKCGYMQDVDGDDLPSNACDSTDFECAECKHTFIIGWYAEVEVRDDKLTDKTKCKGEDLC